MHDDVREIARMTGVHFALDVALNRDQAITRVFAGELFAEHAAACAHVKRTAMRAVPAPFDVVLTTNSGYPLDQNLYQAVKGMSAAACIVKPGGTIICAAECRDGLPDHGPYGQLLRQRQSPASAARDGRGARVRRAGRLAGAGAGADPAQGAGAGEGRRPHRTSSCAPRTSSRSTDVGMAVRQALADAGAGATLAVLPHGPQTIPYLAPASPD